MEEMRKFVCKFCNKRYPCGKSLGGHIRTHMTQPSSNNAIADSVKFESNDTDAARKKKKKKNRDLSSDYGLRENPRKTTRFVHPKHTLLLKEKLCKECGKGFPSLKALCGHMACHSEKDKQKLEMMDGQSDTESSGPKGSKRVRFTTLNNHNIPTSSSVSEVEQEQEEEVAMSLMLLSKDFSTHRSRSSLVTESNSDNNSAVLVAKSPSADPRVGTNSGKDKTKNSVSNASELVKKVRKDKMKFKFSDSGYFRKVDSNVSIDGVFRNDAFNRPKVEDKYGFEDHDVCESRKMMNNRCCRSRNTESKKLVLENLDCAKFNPFKRAKNDYLSRNLNEMSSKKRKIGFPDEEIYKDGSSDSDSYPCEEKSTDSTDSDSYPSSSSSSQKPESNNKAKKKVKSEKRKEHECPICNKTFRSGQALGGHKRSHFVGGFEENNNVIIKQDSPPSPSPAVPCLIDLNLPAPVDE